MNHITTTTARDLTVGQILAYTSCAIVKVWQPDADRVSVLTSNGWTLHYWSDSPVITVI